MFAFLAPAPVVWYGPKTVAFALAAPGNPYDPVANDVRVEFRGAKGVVERRLAYFDGGVWKATLLARTKGGFRPVVFRNGVRAKALPLITLARVLPGGFVRLGGPKGFRFDDGTPYWPLGHNLAWSNAEVPDLPAYLGKMGGEGLDWARIWADHWDGKNPFWKEGETPKQAGMMIPSVLAKWDGIVAAADTARVRFQMTMFHHGPWSTRVNSNWGENPWNAKNGGWLRTPAEFFTDPKAMALSRAWLRYAVARWGHSPSIMAWELFNEVQWCDPHYEKGGDAILGRWHDAMADYVRSIDPYRHLVTTSSDLDLPIYRKVDYLQPHGYPASVAAMVAGTPKLAKPFFWGEIGPGQLDGSRPVQVAAVRDGIYTALLTGQAGAAQYWTWDRVASQDLEPEFRRAARLVRASGFDRRAGTPRKVDLGVGFGGDLAAVPGMGWGASTQYAYRLPEEADRLGRLSSFLQGKAHPEMQRAPVSFAFSLPAAASVAVRVAGASDAGGTLILDLDGSERARETFAPKAKGRTVTLRVPAGRHTLTLRNDGPDWVQLGRIDVPGMAPRARARAISDGTRAALRIQGEKGVSVTLGGLGLKDGTYRITVADLDGGETRRELAFKGGKAARISLPGRDAFVILTPKP